MASHDARAEIELLASPGETGTRLCAPDVGLLTGAVEAGRVLVAGDAAGWLVSLGRARTLIVPAGVAGTVRGARPERVHHPVGYGDTLYDLAPLDAALEGARTSDAEAATESGAPVFRTRSAGRFWHRPAPGDAPLCRAGDVIAEGEPIGLIEVMKTFAQVPYRAGDSLPARARVVRVIAADGADVDAGDALIEVEPAGPAEAAR